MQTMQVALIVSMVFCCHYITFSHTIFDMVGKSLNVRTFFQALQEILNALNRFVFSRFMIQGSEWKELGVVSLLCLLLVSCHH